MAENTHTVAKFHDACPQCDSDRLEFQGVCAEVCLCDEYKCLDCGYRFYVEGIS